MCITPLKEKSLLKPKEERKISLSLSKKKKTLNILKKILGFYIVVFFLEGVVF